MIQILERERERETKEKRKGYLKRGESKVIYIPRILIIDY